MIGQRLHLKLQQKLSPQQIQLMNLFQVPTASIEQRIKEELEENPALEEGIKDSESLDQQEEFTDTYDEYTDQKEFDFSDYVDDDGPAAYKVNTSNQSKDDKEKSMPLSIKISFSELLQSQVNMLISNPVDRLIAETIIGNIDDSGYLRRELEAIVDDMAFIQNVNVTVKQIEHVLQIVQELDPPGVAARSLQESLSIQLRRKPQDRQSIVDAQRIINEGFEPFSKKHYAWIENKLDIHDQALKLAIDEISKLNPKPGSTGDIGGVESVAVIADFLLTMAENGNIQVTLNSRNVPHLNVSRQYVDMISGYKEKNGEVSRSQKDTIQFVKQRLDAAKWFIDAIHQRQTTLLRTMNAIVDYQKEYFLTGDETKLRPMILKNIAKVIDMDISTISRVASSKYVQTPYGTFSLKHYFSEGLIMLNGEKVSTFEVRNILNEVIEYEDKNDPLTDLKIKDILSDKGYNIARRTITKYREQLHIPVARLRKELK